MKIFLFLIFIAIFSNCYADYPPLYYMCNTVGKNCVCSQDSSPYFENNFTDGPPCAKPNVIIELMGASEFSIEQNYIQVPYIELRYGQQGALYERLDIYSNIPMFHLNSQNWNKEPSAPWDCKQYGITINMCPIGIYP